MAQSSFPPKAVSLIAHTARLKAKLLVFGVAGMLSFSPINEPVFAQQDAVIKTEATQQAYAAGYRAAFTCSATFNAGKKPDEILRDELSGIRPDLQDRVLALKDIQIDPVLKRVTISYPVSNQQKSVRVSQWIEGRGCVLLPVGQNTQQRNLTIASLTPIVRARPTGKDVADTGQPWKKIAPMGKSGNAKLDALVNRAFTDRSFGRNAYTTALLVATPERILAEQYGPGYGPTVSQRTWSVAKSIAATVIGTAVRKNLITVQDTDLLQAWSGPGDPRGEIKLYNLLRMASGLDSNREGNRTERLYFGGGTVLETAVVNSLEVPPQSRYKYANNDTLLATRALMERLPQEQRLAYPYKALIDKIGMDHTYLETDWQGDFILSSQVWTTARDMARLGLLHLQKGVWQGDRLLPAGWVDYITNPMGPQPGRKGGANPTPGYGAQWWLYNERFSEDFPGLPTDAFAARGNRGQILMIIPSVNILIVRRGHDPASGGGFRIHAFAEELIALLKKEKLI